MAARRRKASDAEIFAAVIRVVSRLGPERMTLADVAEAVGLTAGALVQRFGSKRELLLAAVSSANDALPDRLDDLRAERASPLSALVAYAESVARAVEDPDAMANHLAMLQLDVTDPAFRAEAGRYFRVERDTLRRWLEEAVEAGELGPAADPARLAPVVQATLSGTRLVQMVLREGSPEDAVRGAVETVLAPYR